MRAGKQPTETNPMLAVALSYAKRGWWVFPLHAIKDGACECREGADCDKPGKHPAIKGWNKEASTDPAKIEGWWGNRPDRGIGIATGEGSGLTVLDVDGDEGVEELGRLAEAGGMPMTPCSSSRPGRFHYYFAHNPAIKSKSKNIGAKLDTRSDNGYVVAPPSRHATGSTYTWIVPPSTTKVAPWPEFLVDGKRTEKKHERPQKERFAPARDEAKLIAALEHIDRDDEERWSQVGWILGRAYSQGDAGYAIYRTWSAKSRKFNPKRTKAHYYESSAKPSGTVLTTSSIYAWAKEAGWEPPEMQRRDLVTVRASDVVPKKVLWLWPGLFARGKVSLCAGDPGLGKSLITLSIASVISNGGQWPATREKCEAGEVLLVSGEDDLQDTIVPRLIAAGADCSKVHIVELVREINSQNGKVTPRSFSLQTDMEQLEHELSKHEGRISLVGIDPIGAFTGSVDTHKNSDVRGLLMPLSQMAAKFNVAVLVTQHLNKTSGGTAMYRITGSLAFVAAARAAFVVMKDTDDPSRRLMMPVKNNLAVDTFGLAYSIRADENKVAYISWEDKVITGEEVDALLSAPATQESPKLQEAEDWLRRQFIDTQVVSFEEIQKRADAKGLSMRTINKAKAALGVESQKTGLKGGWVWSMPR
jgi:putative DNA primase/helicase